ncbi:MAG: hypothetical protein J1F38_08345 [Muribaculaceae bacterium]|nr:hypothetical protein [Muribaculaceae bacterium]
MVKVGILHSEVPIAGEIIRILVNHPETELVSLYSPLLAGRNVSTVHHGLIGESTLIFTEKINLDQIDLLILTQKSEVSDNIIDRLDNYPDLKIIAINDEFHPDLNKEPGLSEINRKHLVRGALTAYILSPVITPSMIALSPLANFLVLTSDIEIEVTLPEDLVDNSNINKLEEEIINLLKERQKSFNGKVTLIINSNKENNRQSFSKIRLKNSLPIEEIEKIYEQTYDDHNFTFISPVPVSPKEVEGTQKCIIYISKPDADTLEIEVVTDARMRGGAGDAVHILNLFFGLHEKTGLTFKVSQY